MIPRPPANGPGAAIRPPVPPSIPIVPATPPPAAPETAHAAPGEPEKPAPKFQPLRPPLGAGGAIHPPLANPSSTPSPGLVNRNLSVPARPAPQPVRPSLGTPGPSGPRQPLAGETARVTIPPPPAARPTPAAPSAPVVASSAPVLPATPVSRRHLLRSPGTPANIAPTAIVLPASPRLGAQPQSPSAAPGTPLPPRPAPTRPQVAASPGLTPGAPIAPRPQSIRSLAGQPIARPVVPPRQDVLDRLQKSRPVSPAGRPSASRCSARASGAANARSTYLSTWPDSSRPGHARSGQSAARFTEFVPSPPRPSADACHVAAAARIAHAAADRTAAPAARQAHEPPRRRPHA